MSLAKHISNVLKAENKKSLLGMIFSLEGLKLFADGNVGLMKLGKGHTTGTLVGEDQFGNKYYENMDTGYGRRRWVVYGDTFNYSPTSVPPEWHGWLECSTDVPGDKHNYIQPIYKVEPYVSRTGTSASYAPKGAWQKQRRSWKKVEFWQPPQ